MPGKSWRKNLVGYMIFDPEGHFIIGSYNPDEHKCWVEWIQGESKARYSRKFHTNYQMKGFTCRRVWGHVGFNPVLPLPPGWEKDFTSTELVELEEHIKRAQERIKDKLEEVERVNIPRQYEADDDLPF